MTKLAYLASPYSRAPGGIVRAWADACTAAGQMILQGHAVYSPIAHTHPIAMHAHIDPLDHERWMKRDAAMMERCDELWIVKMPGWNESVGIAIERATFELARKPERMLSWPALEFEGDAP